MTYTKSQNFTTMDIELEKQIESLERLRDKAIRLRGHGAADRLQSEIDRLAVKSRNRKKQQKNQDYGKRE